jgi:curved DNA-binding protein CbpA
MSTEPAADYYEVLQISPNAEPETVHRVYRLLAQRYHPDNQETGNDVRFRELTAAYEVLGDPERRAKYDVAYGQQRQDRWHLVSTGAHADHDFETERLVRLTVLEVLYTKRRVDPTAPGVAPLDLEQLTGVAREHLEFTIWYLTQKKWVARSDNSLLFITADGAEHLEEHYDRSTQRRRLNPHTAGA